MCMVHGCTICSINNKQLSELNRYKQGSFPQADFGQFLKVSLLLSGYQSNPLEYISKERVMSVNIFSKSLLSENIINLQLSQFLSMTTQSKDIFPLNDCACQQNELFQTKRNGRYIIYIYETMRCMTIFTPIRITLPTHWKWNQSILDNDFTFSELTVAFSLMD